MYESHELRDLSDPSNNLLWLYFLEGIIHIFVAFETNTASNVDLSKESYLTEQLQVLKEKMAILGSNGLVGYHHQFSSITAGDGWLKLEN